jgi:uncharacterized protein (DUF697 family)
VLALVQELRANRVEDRPLVVGGTPELAAALRRELVRGGVESYVRAGGPVEGAAALVYVLAGPPDEAQVAELRAADRARVPIVALVTGRTEVASLPYVLATDIVHAEPGRGFPVDELAARVAHRVGDGASGLARRLPALRRPVCDALIARAARQNAIVGLVPYRRGPDFTVMALNQVRLVLRIADAHGYDVDAARVPELLATFGAGIGMRAVARELLDLVPVAGWIVKGGVAFAGTRAVGEAAVRYFEARAPVTRTPAGPRSLP